MFRLCGIAGEIDYEFQSTEQIKKEFEYKAKVLLSRRGPDQNGVYRGKNALLIHSRLSIVDIENGKQPMEINFMDNKYVIVYNGELYNTAEIKKQLQSLGHTFLGYSDTEVVIRAYIHWGAECLNKFNGIFAFAIWDSNQKELFLARDRIGVKPLFFCTTNDILVFGSEIKVLLAHPMIKACLDKSGILELLMLGPGRTPGCGVLKGIKELKPGQYAIFNKYGFNALNYWKVEDRQYEDNFEQATEKVRYLLLDSIKRQMVSDVPICTFLSGGLDSSIITSVVARQMRDQGRALTSYSVDYLDNQMYFKPSYFQPGSDDEYIGYMKNYCETDHKKVIITPENLANALYEAVQARDLPGMADIDSSLLLFCKEVKKGHTVALSGECADELFGGYPWYNEVASGSLDGFPWCRSTEFREKFIKNGILDTNEMDDYAKLKYIQSIKSTPKMHCKTIQEVKMRELTKLNMDWFMQTLLDRKDRMSMFSGLEVRVPFCDYRIVEYAYCIPWEFKNYKGREKGLLRYAMRDILPEQIVHRKKSPYPKVCNPGYTNLVKKMLLDILKNPNSPIFEFIKKEALENLIQNTQSVAWYGQLMNIPQIIGYFVQMNHWLKLYDIEILI